MNKKITVIPATGGAYRDLTIEPGTTPRDIKQSLGLANEYVLTRGRGSEPIPDDENIYESLSDGAKLYATTDVQWGGIILDLLLGPQPEPKPARVYRAFRPSTNRSTIIRRQPTPYWVERGWTREGQGYRGLYKTAYGNWAGWISESPAGRIDVFISRPPSQLRRHPHWPCFRKREEGWFYVHPINDVPNVSAAILAVEKTLTEAFVA